MQVVTLCSALNYLRLIEEDGADLSLVHRDRFHTDIVQGSIPVHRLLIGGS